MNRLTAALFVFATSLWDPSSASACDCSVPPIDIAIRQADVVISGSVTRIEVTETTGVLRVNVYVRETLKGQASGNFTIYSHPFGASCLGYNFQVGREYVVFAAANDPRRQPFHMPEAPSTGHVVHLCGGTADLQNPVGNDNRRLEEARQRLRPHSRGK